MLVTVQVVGDELVVAKLRTSEAVIREESRFAMEKTRDVLQAARFANVPKDTGLLSSRLSADIKVDRSVKRVTSEYGYAPPAEYGRFVDKGTGVYGPLKRPFMVRQGTNVYLHPGMAGRYFESRSLYETRGPMKAFWGDAGRRIAERLN